MLSRKVLALLAAFLFATPALASEVGVESELEVDVASTENPSWTLPYPPLSGSAVAGGFLHPFSTVNPLAYPFAGVAPGNGLNFPAPSQQQYSAAAISSTPVTAALLGGLNPYVSPYALHPPVAANGNFPAWHFPTHAGQGAYNAHGLDAGWHPGLGKDLAYLGGSPDGATPGAPAEAAAFLESHAKEMPDGFEGTDASEEGHSYGLYPAPALDSSSYLTRSLDGSIGPHSVQQLEVGENPDPAEPYPALVETEAEAETETEAQLENTMTVFDSDCENCKFE